MYIQFIYIYIFKIFKNVSILKEKQTLSCYMFNLNSHPNIFININ